MMNRQELIKKIEDSNISDERKRQILGLIGAAIELDADTISNIKDIIQDDIDENVSDLLNDDQKKTIESMELDADAQIVEVAEDLKKDLDFVDMETDKLQQDMTNLEPVLNQIDIDRVKENL